MKKKIIIILCIAIIVIGALSLFEFETKDKNSALSKEKFQKINNSSDKEQSFIDIDLYFDGSEKNKESKVVKEERVISKEELYGEAIMRELIKGPSVVSDCKAILPKETKVISFSIKDGIAYINLSGEAQTKMSKEQEKTTLMCIANSLTQLKSVTKIMITIDNKNIDSLGGNYNISKPFTKQDVDKLKMINQ